MFLLQHGLTLTASQNSYETVVLAVAQGEMDKGAIAEFFRKHSKK